MTEQTFSAYSPASQEAIKSVRPGLSGVGSIIFRGEEDMLGGMEDPTFFYNQEIGPYKSELEEWYVSKVSYTFTFDLFSRLGCAAPKSSYTGCVSWFANAERGVEYFTGSHVPTLNF